MKFKNISTGVILEPKTKLVEEQLSKSNMYKEVKETAKKKTEKAE